MKRSILLSLLAMLAITTTTWAADKEQPLNEPPEGFTAVFNGKDLSGWFGMGHLDPRKLAEMSDEERAKLREESLPDVNEHWSVENGELVNDGHGKYLTTNQDFGDIELYIDYKTVPKADSGIYLRGTPQVQIWDWNQVFNPKRPTRKPHLGSGGLFNNAEGSKGRHPLVLADKPFGEWNQFRIIQVGSTTWVWLNEKLVVDGAEMANYWDRSKPLPAKGPIMLQTHGGEIRWRNLFVREIPEAEGQKLLSSVKESGE